MSSFIRALVVRFGSLIYIAFLARALTDEELTTVFFIAISITIIIYSSDFGLDYSMKQRSIFYGGDKGMNILKSCFLSIMALGILYSGILTMLFIVFIASLGNVQLSLEAQIEFLLINISGVIFRTIISAETTLMKIDRAQFLNLLNAVLLYILVIVLFTIRPVIESVLIAMTIPNICILFVEFRTVKTIMKYGGISKNEIFKFMKFGLPVFLGVILKTLSVYVDRWIIFAAFSEEEFSTYHLMRKISQIVTQTALVLTTGLFPIYTALYADSDERLSKGFSHVLRIGLIISIPFFLILFFFAKPAIIFLLGEKWVRGGRNGDQILMVLLIAGIFYFLGVMIMNIKVAKGETIEYLSYWILFLILNIVFGMLLLPYGVVAIAFAILIVSIILCIYAIAITKETRKVPHKWLSRFFAFTFFTLIILFLSVKLIPFPFSLIITLLIIPFLPALFGLISLHEFEVIRRVTPQKIEKIVLFYEKISRVGFLPPIHDLT